MGMFIMSLGEFADIYDSFARTPMDGLPKVRKTNEHERENVTSVEHFSVIVAYTK